MKPSRSLGVLLRPVMRQLEEGVDTLQSCRNRAKLKWWYKLATLPDDRYLKQLFNQEWNIKPHCEIWMTIMEWVESMGVASGRG